LPLRDPSRVEGDVVVTEAVLSHLRTRLANEGAVILRAGNGGMAVEKMRVVGDNTAGDVRGRVGFDGKLDLQVTGAMELQLFTLWVDNLKSAEGRLEIDGAIRGTLAKPAVTAGLKVRQGRLQLADVNLLFDDIAADGAFAAGQIVIESMRARMGAGSMSGGGILTMDGLVPTAVSLYATLTEAEARVPQWLQTRANGRVEMTGPLDDVLMRGDLEIVQSLYNERIDWEALILRFRAKPPEPATLAKKKGFHVDLGVHSAGSVFVKNNLADLKLRGDLQVVGYPPDLGMTGNLQIVSGNVLFRENAFNVQSGQINFADPDRVRPIIDLTAKTRVEEASSTATRRFDDITLSASGPADDLQIEFESSPPMSREDIISLLYIRRRSEDLGGGETAGPEAVSLAFKLNDDLAGFQSEVQQYFGFENLVLEPSFTDTTRSGTLKLRAEKTLRKDLKASISTSLSSTDLDFWLDYALTDNMLLDFGWNSVEEIRGSSSNVGNFKIRPRLHFEFQ
jgi:autotransporter translocation and assembly factor TamB